MGLHTNTVPHLIEVMLELTGKQGDSPRLVEIAMQVSVPKPTEKYSSVAEQRPGGAVRRGGSHVEYECVNDLRALALQRKVEEHFRFA